jgi:superfamily II RNA helicase
VELQGESPLDLQECDEALRRILGCLRGIRKLMARRGFENPSILFWPAAALFLWAKGVGWERLLSFVPVDEGDMASLIVRTADHLRQVTNLMETPPGLASAARVGIELILREPVFLE